MKKNKTPHLPYPYYFLTALFLTIIGIIDTLYLGYAHYKNYTDLTYASFCALSKAINCDTVAQSPWSVFIGIPVAYWGFLGYLLIALALFRLRKKEKNLFLWNIVLCLSLIYSLVSIFLGYISSTRIHSYCILCLLSYTINFCLLLVSWITTRRFSNYQTYLNFISSLKTVIASGSLRWQITGIIALFAIFSYTLPPYWQFDFTRIAGNPPTGVTEEGHPWIGGATPSLVIEEFSDYQCFQCSKMHFFLRNLISKNPEKIRLIHRNYPMDHEYNQVIVPSPFHVGSGKMALLAIYSVKFDKFWEMNDALYRFGAKKEPFNLKTLSEETDIPVASLSRALTSQYAKEMLQYDIWHGMKHAITGTPTYVINGTPYVGTIPAEILQKALH